VNNDVRIVVDAQNRTATAFGAAAKGAKTVGDAANIAGQQLRQMEAKLDDANVKARRLAEAEERAAARARDLAVKTALLRQELASSGDKTGELGEKLARMTFETRAAANATDDYRRSANRAAAEAREQARAYDRVADNARQAARAVALLGASAALSKDGKKGGGSIFRSLADISGGFLTQGLGGAGSAIEGAVGTPVLGPALLAAGATAAIPAGSFLGGAAGGAIGAGGALGGAGLGLAGAWMGQPEKFSAEWTSSIDRVKKRWIDSSAAFGDELEQSLKTADGLLQNLPVEKVLAISQSFVNPLVTGAAQGAGSAANGFADALAKAQPIVDKLGPALAGLGHDAGDALRIISEGSEGGADALSDLVGAVGFTVKAVATLILGFELAYEKIRNFAISANEVATTMPGVGVAVLGVESALLHIGSTSEATARTLSSAGDSAHDTAFDWGEMGAAAAEAAVNALGLNDALTELRNTQLAQKDAALAVAQGWFDLNDALKEGKHTLDESTEAGIAHQKAIVGQIELLEQQREQAIKTGGGTEEAIAAANAAYDAQIEKLRQAAYAAGLDHKAVDDLIASLGNASKINATPTVEVKGLAESLRQGESLRQRLDQIDGRTAVANVYVQYHTAGQSLNAPLRAGGISHAATGGPQGGLTEVGEEGREVVRMPTGVMVYPHANANQMAMQASAQRIQVDLNITGHGALYEAVMAGQRSGELQIFTSAIVDD
jgi:hypothetical protein